MGDSTDVIFSTVHNLAFAANVFNLFREIEHANYPSIVYIP